MIVHHVTQAQIDVLEQKFTKLTWRGWVTPAWIKVLRDSATR